MSKRLASQPGTMLSALSDFNIRTSDTFKITGSKGVLSIHKRKASGHVESLRVRANGSFKQMTQFDPNDLTIQERRKLEFDMHESGLSQSEIADLLGVSQAKISLDLKKFKAKKAV